MYGAPTAPRLSLAHARSLALFRSCARSLSLSLSHTLTQVWLNDNPLQPLKADGTSGGVIDEERGPTFLESLQSILPPQLSHPLIAGIAAPFPNLHAPSPPPHASPDAPDPAAPPDADADRPMAATAPPTAPPPPPASLLEKAAMMREESQKKASSSSAGGTAAAKPRPWASLHTLVVPAHYTIQAFHAPTDSLPELGEGGWPELMRADAAGGAPRATTSAVMILADSRRRRAPPALLQRLEVLLPIPLQRPQRSEVRPLCSVLQ